MMTQFTELKSNIRELRYKHNKHEAKENKIHFEQKGHNLALSGKEIFRIFLDTDKRQRLCGFGIIVEH